MTSSGVDSYCVKGSVLRSKLEAYASVAGEGAARSLENRLRPGLPRMVNPLEWYPYDLLERVLEDMRINGFDGKVARLAEIGRETARILLESTYRPLTISQDWPTFMRTSSRLHREYYSHGEMMVDFDQVGVCRVDLVGAPRYAVCDLHVAGGFYCGSAEILGNPGRTYRLQTDGGGAHFEL